MTPKKPTRIIRAARGASAAVRRTGMRMTARASSGVQRTGTKLTESAARTTARTERQAERSWSAAKRKFHHVDARVTKYIKENPKKAALIAASVGAALAAAVAATMRRRK